MPQKKIDNVMASNKLMELPKIRDAEAELQAEDLILILI
jgi:hypothetical protein